MPELYQKYRPKKLADVAGQPSAVSVLAGLLAKKKFPHAVLFAGPTGTGKTTLARICSRELGCTDPVEYNCGSIEPMETVRDLELNLAGYPLVGAIRSVILDEAQALSRARFAQEGLLKILEEQPEHGYVFLCSTDPKKILPAIRGRCTILDLKPLKERDLHPLVVRVAQAEGADVSDELVDRIIRASNGSAREALVKLETALAAGEDDSDRLATVVGFGEESQAFDLVKALMPFRGEPTWAAVAAVLKALEDHDAEGLRHMVLASARTALLRGDKKAYKVLYAFESNFWDSKHAGLCRACWEVVAGK